MGRIASGVAFSLVRTHSMADLQVLMGAEPGRSFPLSADEIIVGRNPDCGVFLNSPSVSRQHARISHRNGSFLVEDLQSRNGTYVNGELLLRPRVLHDGDQVTICETTLIFRLRTPEADDSESLPADPRTATSMVDDEQSAVDSKIVSRVELSSGPQSLVWQVNSEAKLKALLEITKGLGKTLDLREVLARILEGLFRIFVRADRGFVIIRDHRTGRLVPMAVRCRKACHAETIRISRTIVNTVMNSREAVLSADAATDSRFLLSDSIVDFQIRSMMCAPLVGADGRVLGVIQIDTLDQRNRFTREDLDVLAAVAVQAAFAVENAELHEAVLREQALARELAVAHEVQRGLLPADAPLIDGYQFFAFYEPARQLGGDYYDYVTLLDGRVAVVIGDVAGKGISASLLMARLSAQTRHCLGSRSSPAEALRRLNMAFCESGWDDRFVTFAVCVLDGRRHEATMVNAGHPPPLLRRANGEIAPLATDQGGLPLGVDPSAYYDQTVVPLAIGDCMVLYTDGITEALNNADEVYGRERLEAQLAAARGCPREIGEAIMDDVRRFVGDRPQSDDICLNVVGRVAC